MQDLLGLLKPSGDKQWRNAVKQHARRIKGLVEGTELFGQKFSMNDKNALIVAIYLKGVHDGTENSKKVLRAMQKKNMVK